MKKNKFTNLTNEVGAPIADNDNAITAGAPKTATIQRFVADVLRIGGFLVESP